MTIHKFIPPAWTALLNFRLLSPAYCLPFLLVSLESSVANPKFPILPTPKTSLLCYFPASENTTFFFQLLRTEIWNCTPFLAHLTADPSPNLEYHIPRVPYTQSTTHLFLLLPPLYKMPRTPALNIKISSWLGWPHIFRFSYCPFFLGTIIKDALPNKKRKEKYFIWLIHYMIALLLVISVYQNPRLSIENKIIPSHSSAQTSPVAPIILKVKVKVIQVPCNSSEGPVWSDPIFVSPCCLWLFRTPCHPWLYLENVHQFLDGLS